MILEPLQILIIDDDEINNFIAVKLIDKIQPKADIFTCLNGVEGINFIKDRLEEQHKIPDVIFLDINMPVMNGWEFLDEYETIKDQISKNVVINMLSSSVYNDDISKAETYTTVDKFLSKPLTIEKIKGIYDNIYKSTEH